MILIVIIALVCAPACALTANDLCFYAPFEDSLDAVYAVGNPKPAKIEGEYTFVRGVSGKALSAGEAGKTLAYAVKGNLPGRKGTISVWIKALEWAAGDFKGHAIITVPDEFRFYHAAHSGGIHLEWLKNWGGSTYNYPQGPVKGEWKHLVWTWGDGGVTLYQNGRFVSRIDLTNRVYFPASPKEFPEAPTDLLFHICDPSLTSDGKNATVIDELMMFNRPLQAAEVRSLFRGVEVQSQEVMNAWRAGSLVVSLESSGPKELFQGKVIRLPETVARISLTEDPPKIDGTFGEREWANTAEFSDFCDVPFGNFTSRSVRANLSYDDSALYVCVRSHQDGAPHRVDGVEIRFSSGSDEQKIHIPNEQIRSVIGEISSVRCFEAAIPWTKIGLSQPKSGDSLRMSIIRRWSDRFGDVVIWGGLNGYAKIIFGGSKPALCLTSLGKLNYAQLDLKATVSAKAAGFKAEVRLQPSDLREYYDSKTLPGTKSYTGTRIALDRAFGRGEKGEGAVLRATHSFSDTDIDSLWLKVTDAKGEVVYQAQRSFVPRPPITIALQTYPDHDRLRIEADVSNYRKAPLEEISAEITLSGKMGRIRQIRHIVEFTSVKESLEVPLSKLPTGKINVTTVLKHGKSVISRFTSSFTKLPRGPWVGNKLGKDDIVIPPFTPVKVEGRSVSVWGRTYKWENSLFPVQVTSSGKELLAAPIELSAGDNKADPAVVTVGEQKPTRVIVEAKGTLAGVPVTARHLIEYDGMCLTTLTLIPPIRLDSLSLRIPYRKEHATLYMMSPQPACGAVMETSNPTCPPMNGKRDCPFEHSVWLGSEERGMTWFAETGGGWVFQDNGTPIGIAAVGDVTSLTLRFSTTPLKLDKPLSLTFGIIATPVKPMRDNWRFLRNTRDWSYRWYGVFTAANNDIAHPFPSFKKYLEEQHKSVPLHVPYQMPVFANTRQPETTYYGEEWLFPPRTVVGNDQGDEERHISVCLGSSWIDFMVYYAVKAYDDLHMDGYYLDGAIPDGRGCANTLHGHGWTDSGGNPRGTYAILAHRELIKRLAVEFYKRKRPYLLFVHLSGSIDMPCFTFADMGWNGEQFSTNATPLRDYNKLLSLSYFRTQFIGAQFGIPIQMLLEYWKKEGDQPIGPAEIDSALGLSLVHGVGDNIMAGNFYSMENWDYAKRVLDAQDSFGIREKDCEFLPYWKESDAYDLRPDDENLVCSVWKRPGKILVIVNNSTQSDQLAVVRLQPAKLGLPDKLKAIDLIMNTREDAGCQALHLDVKKSNWRMVVVEAE